MTGPAKAILASGGLLLIWVTFALVAYGLGRIVRWTLGLSVEDSDDPWFTCWLGIALACTALLAWSFVARIDGTASVSLAVIGLIASVRARRDLLRASRMSGLVLGRVGLVAALGFSLWLANHARGDLTHFDSGNYQIQSVRWATAFPVVPGLANLHSRLGYQSAAVPLYAAIDSGPFRGQGHHLANGFLLFLLGTGSIVSIFSYGRPQRRSLFGAAAAAGALAVAVAWIALEDTVTSFATDVPVTALGFAMAIAFIEFVSGKRGTGSPPATRFAAVALLAAVAVALKFVFMAVAVGVFVVGVWVLWTQEASSRLRLRAVVLASSIAILPVGLTLARSAITSGYPLYPSSVMPLSVDWRVPVEQTHAEVRFIRATARLNETEVGVNPRADDLSNWLPRWLKRQLAVPFNLLMPFGIVIIGLGAIALRGGAYRRMPALRALAPFVLGMLAWWQVAPMSRWAVVPFWLAAAWVVAGPLQELSVIGARRLLWCPAILALLLARVLDVGGPDAMTRVRAFASALAGDALTDRWVSRSVPQPALKTYVTDTGVRLNVPIDGRCWDTALPCTPTPARNLELRNPTDLRNGFRVRGNWQAEGWPGARLPHFK